VLSGLLTELGGHPALAELLPPEPLVAVVRGGPASRRLAAFLFDGKSRTPALFVKLTRDDEMRARLRQEHATLACVAALPALVGTVPVPLALLEHDGATVSVHTTVAGTSLAALTRRSLRPGSTRHHLTATVRWLELLQRATAQGRRPLVDAAAFGDRAALTLAAVASPATCRRLCELAAAFGQVEVPAVRRHGDFWPGNVLANGSTVGVVDWEHSVDGASPTTDLFMLLSTHAFLTPGRGYAPRSRGAGVAAAWRPSSRLSARYRAEAVAFLRRLGVDGPPLELLVVDFLLQMVEAPPFGSPDDWRTALGEIVADRRWHDGREAGEQ
jgi:aminoglycoside phosphotransferase (APT) family kinase protein